MKKILTFLLALWLMAAQALATEGMWLPLLLKQLNEAEMQSMGMKMSAEDIYSVNRSSLKDAIVRIGGCTGEIISGQGLLLTNHHCGYGQIQSHSSLENNYLQDGFWAMNRDQELPNPGLTATFIVRIEDVTEQVLANVTPEMHYKERQAWVTRNTELAKEAAVREAHQDVMIRPFFEGNQYFLFVTETFRDVRLVGAPPSSIGKFGADTDNWVWPRHTGDFALFRVYASPDNLPADYAAENVPLKPRHFLPISLDGVEEGDFTLVFGFPGLTEQYLPSYAIEQRINVVNPILIGVRDRSLNVINEAMRRDAQVRIQYASKQARIANAWKKWIGESQGVKATDGIGRKKAFEQEFTQRVRSKSEWQEAYGGLLERFGQLYAELEPYAKSNSYISEIAGRNVELFMLANNLHSLVRQHEQRGSQAIAASLPRVQSFLDGFFKDFQQTVDEQVFASLMEVYFAEVHPDHQSAFAIERFVEMGKDPARMAQTVYGKSRLLQPEALRQALAAGPDAFVELVRGDLAYQLARSIADINETKVLEPYNRIRDELKLLQQQYMQAQMEVFPERRFYPDANGTLRVTYGKVDGYAPRDAVRYEPMTYLDGVIEKYVPGDYEFDLPQRLRELYQNKDYGAYADASGRVPVCFIGSNHTTGGNSGSPSIDAHGNLIGLNFDRVWEGTMSDINYDASICRNIMVDARYILFIIDKFAGAGHLLEEMKLVHPKRTKAER
jgi:hypothetical protein